MSSLFRPWTLLFALACACVVSLPFFTTALSRRDVFLFEIEVATSDPGVAQLFYDVGRNFNEEDSGHQWLNAGSKPTKVRLGLPSGTYRGLRFDPSDREAVITLTHAQILDDTGKVVRRFTSADFKATNQIASVTPVPDGIELHMTPGANDSSLVLSLEQPLVLKVGPKYWLLRTAKTSGVAFVIALGLAIIPYGRIGGGRLVRLATWARLHPHQAVVLTAIVAVAVQCHPVIFFGKSFVSPNNAVYLLYDTYPTLPGYSDTELEDAKGADVGAMMWQHLSYPILQRDSIFKYGELPLWNRYDLCGVPMLGQGQTMFGDPMNVVTMVLNGASWAWDARFVIMRVLFATGIGLAIYLLVRHLGAALLITASMPFLGFFAFRLNHPAILSVCWSPWVLVSWCWLLNATGRKERNLSLAALVVVHICMMTSGTIKEAAMLAACLDFAGALLILLARISWRDRLSKLASAIFAGVVFFLISAPGWLTFLLALGKSRTNYDKPAASQLPPWQIIGFFEDLFYRQFRPGELQFEPSANFVILAGVLWALVMVRGLVSDRRFVAVGVASLVPLAFVFGGIPASLIVRLPFIANIIHIDNTFSCPLIVLTAVVAGFGLASAARQLAQANAFGSYLLFVALLGAMTLLYFGSTQGVAKSDFFVGYIPALFVVLLAAPLAVRYALRSGGPRALGLILVAGLVLLLWRHSQYLSTPFDAYVLNPKVRVALDAPSPAVDYVNAHRTEPERTVGLGYNLFPGYNQVLLWESIYGVDAVRSKYIDDLAGVTPLRKLADWVSGSIEQEDIGPALPMHDLLNVRYYLAKHQKAPRALAGRKYLASLDLDVFESPTVWPRAFFTSTLAVYNTQQDFAAMVMKGDRRPFAAVQERDRAKLPSELFTLPETAPSRVIAAAHDYGLTSNTTRFSIDAARPGVIVLTESYYPGDFQVTLNDEPVPYFRVNHAFKGVYVSKPGTYRVEFAYWPDHLTLALALCAGGVLLAIAGLVVDVRWRRSAGANVPVRV